jgi:GNAT superfamily N-acetyltransferase
MGDITKPLRGKPAHERTLEEFVGWDPVIAKGFANWNEQAFILHRFGSYTVKARNIYCTKPAVYGTSDPRVTRKVFHCYHVAILDDKPTYALLLADAIDADTGEVWIPEGIVGEFYRDDLGLNLLGILESHRGKGVAPHFVASAIEATGNVHPSGAYSPAGFATRKKAHRILVENAIKRGDSVPMQVLKEYEKGK